LRGEASLAMQSSERQSLKYIGWLRGAVAFDTFGHDRLRVAFYEARKGPPTVRGRGGRTSIFNS